MDSDDLTKAQAQRMHATVFKYANYLARVLERMKAKRWPHTDPIDQQTKAAYDAACSLCHGLHYNSMDGGVAMKSRAERERQTKERRERGEL